MTEIKQTHIFVKKEDWKKIKDILNEDAIHEQIQSAIKKSIDEMWADFFRIPAAEMVIDVEFEDPKIYELPAPFTEDQPEKMNHPPTVENCARGADGTKRQRTHAK